MATKKKTTPAPKTRIHLVESDSKTPMIVAKPGVRIELVSVSTPDGRPSKLAARLCGGSGTCVALIETE